jgi:hypothetical protein
LYMIELKKEVESHQAEIKTLKNKK